VQQFLCGFTFLEGARKKVEDFGGKEYGGIFLLGWVWPNSAVAVRRSLSLKKDYGLKRCEYECAQE